MSRPGYDSATSKPIYNPITGKPALACAPEKFLIRPCYELSICQHCTPGTAPRYMQMYFSDVVLNTGCLWAIGVSSSYGGGSYISNLTIDWPSSCVITTQGGECSWSVGLYPYPVSVREHFPDEEALYCDSYYDQRDLSVRLAFGVRKLSPTQIRLTTTIVKYSFSWFHPLHVDLEVDSGDCQGPWEFDYANAVVDNMIPPHRVAWILAGKVVVVPWASPENTACPGGFPIVVSSGVVKLQPHVGRTIKCTDGVWYKVEQYNGPLPSTGKIDSILDSAATCLCT